MHFLWQIMEAIWQTAVQMAPWLLFGFFAAGCLSLLLSPETICRFLGRTAGNRAIALAVLLGVPLPLCSCGVLPVAAGLKRAGASKGAVAAFLISTPQTGIDSFFATGSLLGWCFALMRPLVATVTGILGGIVIHRVDETQEVVPIAMEAQTRQQLAWWQKGIAIFTYGYGTLLKGVAPALFVGLLISALITVFVPAHFFEASLLGNDWVAFPVMLLIGMPMYVCSTASIPVALSLMAKGISPGAALIFLIVGPALNGASLTMLLQLLGKKCLALYLLILSVASILAGLLLNSLNAQWEMLPSYAEPCLGGCALKSDVAIGCAVILFALLGWHLVIRRMLPLMQKGARMETLTEKGQRVTVKGMRCEHCRGLVRRTLQNYASVTSVEPMGEDSFEVVGTLPETLAADLEALGFELAE